MKLRDWIDMFMNENRIREENKALQVHDRV